MDLARLQRTALFAFVAGLTACGGNAGTGAGRAAGLMPAGNGHATPGPQSSPQDVAVSVTIDGPAAGSSATREPRPTYLSPAMKSLTISVNGGAPVAQNLTTTSPGCSVNAAGAPTCTLSIAAPPGGDSFAFASYTGLNGTGSVLSVNMITSTISGSGPNNVAVTLGGVPKSILVSVAPGQTNVLGNQNTGFTLQGAAPATFIVNALDAAEDTIVGPGAPAIALSPSSPALTAAPLPGSNDAYTLAATSSAGETVMLGVTATGSGGAGNAAANVAFTLVPVPAPPPSSLPKATYVYENVVDIGGSTAAGEIDVFPPGSIDGAQPKKIVSPLLYPFGGSLAFGADGALYATGYTDKGALVVKYTAAQLDAGSGPTTIVDSYYATSNANQLLEITSLGVDSHGNLFVVGEPNAYPPVFSVYEYPAGSSPTTKPIQLPSSPTNITAPTFLYVDGHDNLYVVNAPQYVAESVLVFSTSTPLTAPVRTIAGSNVGFGTVSSLAAGADGTLTLFDGTTFEGYVFKPGANGNVAPSSVFQSAALNYNSPITVDANNNVYGSQFFITPVSYSLTAFPAGANGVVPPLFSVQSPLLSPAAILVGPYHRYAAFPQ